VGRAVGFMLAPPRAGFPANHIAPTLPAVAAPRGGVRRLGAARRRLRPWGRCCGTRCTPFGRSAQTAAASQMLKRAEHAAPMAVLLGVASQALSPPHPCLGLRGGGWISYKRWIIRFICER